MDPVAWLEALGAWLANPSVTAAGQLIASAVIAVFSAISAVMYKSIKDIQDDLRDIESSRQVAQLSVEEVKPFDHGETLAHWESYDHWYKVWVVNEGKHPSGISGATFNVYRRVRDESDNIEEAFDGPRQGRELLKVRDPAYWRKRLKRARHDIHEDPFTFNPELVIQPGERVELYLFLDEDFEERTMTLRGTIVPILGEASSFEVTALTWKGWEENKAIASGMEEEE